MSEMPYRIYSYTSAEVPDRVVVMRAGGEEIDYVRERRPQETPMTESTSPTIHTSGPGIHERITVRYSDGEDADYVRESRPLVAGLGLWAAFFLGLVVGLFAGAGL